jgi:hypothetical protein
MSNSLLETFKRQTQALTADEKLDLADYLRAQAELDRTQVQAEAAPALPDPYRRREYAWLRTHRDEYAGQYVALFNDELIAHGTDGRDVLRAARAAGFPRALLVRVEAADELPFGGW